MAKRARKTAETNETSQQPETSVTNGENPTDAADPALEFDPTKLESHTGNPTHTMQLAASSPIIPVQPVMPRISDQLPDPRPVDQISMSDNRDGPKMRLLRSHRNHEVWIQFDENPGKTATDPIKTAGFRWEHRAEVNDKKGAWVMPLGRGHEISSMLNAERLFKTVANQIREAKGLEPVGVSGHGAA